MRRPVLMAVLAAALALAAPASAKTHYTGRLLVLLDRGTHAQPRAVAAAADAIPAGHSVPQIGLVTVRPRPGETLHELAVRLRRQGGVASVQPEARFHFREVPSDPVFTDPETAFNTPSGTTEEWWAAREHLPEAWDVTHGTGAVVAVIDSGIDASHPEFAGRIKETIDLDDTPGDGGPTIDEQGHGTHVAGLACAIAGNGVGIAGAGYGCSLLVIKSDLSDSSVAQAIIDAVDHGADAINMSFGEDGRAQAPDSEIRAVRYAYDHNVVVAAAAADSAVTEQGDPANVLQPTGTGATLGSGLGLSVTAADFDDKRASFAGYGSQISIAAYGAFHYGAIPPSGPPGILSTFPAQQTQIDAGPPPCNCRATVSGSSSYAYLSGTSMSTPMVTAIAALVRNVNPGLHAADVIRIIEETATRPGGSGWNQDLGWGIVNASAALDAARGVDRTPPTSRLKAPSRVRAGRSFTLRWTGHDPALPGLAASGIARFEVWRSVDNRTAKRIASTTRHSMRLRAHAGSRYAFFTIAVDKAGNRQPRPKRPQARTRVVR
jgi:serine protease